MPKKKAPHDQLDVQKLKQYEAELRAIYRGDYPSKLLVKGDRIETLREWIGKHENGGVKISQEALANRAGLLVDQATIARYEKQHKEVPTLHLYAIARACGVGLHEIAYTGPSLPPPMPASPLYRAKIYVIKSWLTGSFPQDEDIDLQVFFRTDWDDPFFREVYSLTRNQEELLWHSLAQDGWIIRDENRRFHFNKDHRLPPTPAILFRLGHNITNLVLELLSFDHAAYASRQDHVEACFPMIAHALQNAGTAFDHTHVEVENFLEAMRDCDLAFAHSDTIATNVTLHYHDAFAQWTEAAEASLLAAEDKERFNIGTVLTPLFKALYAHREAVFLQLHEDAGQFQIIHQHEIKFRQGAYAFLDTWDALRKHLADLGLLGEVKPDPPVETSKSAKTKTSRSS